MGNNLISELNERGESMARLLRKLASNGDEPFVEKNKNDKQILVRQIANDLGIIRDSIEKVINSLTAEQSIELCKIKGKVELLRDFFQSAAEFGAPDYYLVSRFFNFAHWVSEQWRIFDRYFHNGIKLPEVKIDEKDDLAFAFPSDVALGYVADLNVANVEELLTQALNGGSLGAILKRVRENTKLAWNRYPDKRARIPSGVCLRLIPRTKCASVAATHLVCLIHPDAYVHCVSKHCCPNEINGTERSYLIYAKKPTDVPGLGKPSCKHADWCESYPDYERLVGALQGIVYSYHPPRRQFQLAALTTPG